MFASCLCVTKGAKLGSCTLKASQCFICQLVSYMKKGTLKHTGSSLLFQIKCQSQDLLKNISFSKRQHVIWGCAEPYGVAITVSWILSLCVFIRLWSLLARLWLLETWYEPAFIRRNVGGKSISVGCHQKREEEEHTHCFRAFCCVTGTCGWMLPLFLRTY